MRPWIALLSAAPVVSYNHVDAFVDDVIHGRSLGVNAYHVWPQALKLDVLPEGRSFDLVWHIERFEEGAAQLLELLGRKAALHRSLGIAHESSATAISRVCGGKLSVVNLTDSTVVKLCRLLRVDYACFGYTVPVACRQHVDLHISQPSARTAAGRNL